MADIFLSYSSEDKSKVRLIAFALEKMGWSVWWDRKIVPGTMYDKVIEDELNGARCVIVIWTQRSVASEWVKNEANAGAERKVLVPLLLENVTIPLAFRRMEAARLIDWNGEEDNTELKILINAISRVLGEEKRFLEVDQPDDIEALIGEQDKKKKAAVARLRLRYAGMIAGGIVVALICICYFLSLHDRISPHTNQWLYYLALMAMGISVSMIIAGASKLISRFKGNATDRKLKYTGPVVGIVLVLLGVFFIPRHSADTIITIRVFDPKKKPVTGGQVKLYLPGYIRQQSIDNVGQAQFTGVSSGVIGRNIKIEVTSDGFDNYSVDTTLRGEEPVLLTLTPVRIIHISGKIKTAGEMPLRDVEINVDGTKYYAMSITDGSYTIILKDYSPGDEITLTTSHKDYEDKTRSFRINSSEMKEVDFVLNPVK